MPRGSPHTEECNDCDLWNRVRAALGKSARTVNTPPMWSGGVYAKLPPVGGETHVVRGIVSHSAAWNFMLGVKQTSPHLLGHSSPPPGSFLPTAVLNMHVW